MNYKENNKLIAKFMDAVELPFVMNGNTEILYQECLIDKINGNSVDSELYIHKDWNQIMETIIKIQSQYYKGFIINTTIGKGGAYISINEHNVSGDKFIGNKIIVNTLNLNYDKIEEEEQVSLIDSVYLAIVIYVKWYNLNKEDIK